MKALKFISLLVATMIGIFFLVYFARLLYVPLALESKILGLLQNSKLPNNNDIAVLSIAIITLKNATLVLQFTGIAVAILTFVGAKELLNVRKIRQEIEKQYKELKDEHTKFFKDAKDFEDRTSLLFQQEHNFITAKIFYTQGFYEEAWQILLKMPDDLNYEICLYKGMVLVKRKDYSDAITNFENALQFEKADTARIRFNLALCWYFSKEYKTTIKELDKVIKIRCNYWAAYNLKAVTLRRLGKVNDAIEVLRSIVAIDKKYDKAYYNLACYHSLTNNSSEAILNLEKSIKLDSKWKKKANEDPDFANIKKLSTFTKFTRDDTEEAES